MKTITHNGVPCVEAKGHMLPTEDKSNIILKNNLQLEYNEVKPSYGLNKLGWKYHHLYITTDEEIKEGDWFYDDLNIPPNMRVKQLKRAVNYSLIREDMRQPERERWAHARKIIATTNPKLIYSLTCEHAYISGGRGMCNTMKCCGDFMKTKLSQIPQSFIEEYCKAGGIDRVLVEVEVFGYISEDTRISMIGTDKELVLPNTGQDKRTFKLKTDSNNCIIIHPVEGKMYSEKDLPIQAMKNVLEYCEDESIENTAFVVGFYTDIKKWIEENLQT